MGSPLEQAGATREPSEYAALSMDRAMTGLWTQRSPLRDADVPYVQGKFYSASRFDSIIDGINREITSRLTLARRPGSSVYNSQTFPAINSYYSYKRINAGVEIVRVLADGADGNIYDATGPSTKTNIFTKSGGAGKARFQGVNTALYFSDGVENKKWLQPSLWAAQTTLATSQYQVGTTVIDSNGKLQYLSSVNVGTVSSIQINSNAAILQFVNNAAYQVTPGMVIILTGLSTFTYLNNQLLVVSSVNGLRVVCSFYHANVAVTSDTGTASCTLVGTSTATGGIAPSWGASYGNKTVDGTATWTNFGTPVFDWGPPVGPTGQLQPGALGGTPFQPWQPFCESAQGNMVLAANGQVQVALTGTNVLRSVSGSTLPKFNTSGRSLGIVVDGGQNWFAADWLGGVVGSPVPWAATTAVTVFGFGGNMCVDSNGNLQMATAGTGSTGGVAPTWATTAGVTTTDGTVTWTCQGPYKAITLTGWKYGYAFHCIDGSLSNISPLSLSTYGVQDGVTIQGNYSSDLQVDSIWIFRTAGGQPTPLFLASIPNVIGGGGWSFGDQFPDSSLNPFIIGPQGQANNPPPVGMTAPLYHFGRIWAIYKNTVICSGGPDTLAGNGNTAFQPLNSFPIPEQPIRLFPTITSAGAGILVWGRANVYIILGNGTASNPFQPAARFMAGCGIMNYDAITQIGSTFYAFGNTAKVGGNLVGKAFSLDPGAGYVEYGFPIGDQFSNLTTGAGGRIANSGAALGYLYNPASTFVTWAELGSGDTSLYVADGSVGWFRYSPVASPESGFLWSPRASLVGGTSAVQGVETQPGVTQLLIGPASSGPILFRDSSVNADWSGGAYVSYPSYDVKGCIQLCLSGEVAELAHVHVVSMPQGARPSVGLLFGEILPVQVSPFAWYDRTSSEPPDIKPSATVYSDRYTMLSNGVTPKCLFFQLGMDYGTQNVPDETLMFTLFGAKYAERRQQ